jgi:hypothetical protein
MTDEKLRKKLRKFAKWAKRHGYEHVDLFAIAPNDNHEDEWFAYLTATTNSGEDRSCSVYIKEAEL